MYNRTLNDLAESYFYLVPKTLEFLECEGDDTAYDIAVDAFLSAANRYNTVGSTQPFDELVSTEICQRLASHMEVPENIQPLQLDQLVPGSASLLFHEVLSISEPDPADIACLRQEVEVCLQKATPKQYQIVSMRAAGYSTRETSAICGISLSTFRGRIGRLRSKAIRALKNTA